ncbi:MAG: hypothetical protein D3910_11250, partial [Candidatus Electrothrix sp. ATG2]|nr:hypothetical protein [Candidatus Electrothrix sp. ATG2]
GKRELILSEGIATLIGPERDDGIQQLNTDSLLYSAAEIFGSAVTVLFLSGVDQDMKEGMEAVVMKGGRLILQEPESCLLPNSIEEIRSLGMEECSLKPEEIAPYLSDLI